MTDQFSKSKMKINFPGVDVSAEVESTDPVTDIFTGTIAEIWADNTKYFVASRDGVKEAAGSLSTSNAKKSLENGKELTWKMESKDPTENAKVF